MLLRTTVYIDGYNLYYGCLRGTAHKWLDLSVLFEQWVLPSSAPHPSSLTGIKFFTAPILEKVAKSQDSVSSQSRYHTALAKKYPERIEIIKGYYSLITASAKKVDSQAPKTWARFCEDVQIWKVEEKQSDVNLALQIYHDAINGLSDQLVIVTNDTDIAPALAMVRKFKPEVIIGLVIPSREETRVPNSELAELAHWVRTHITDDEFAKSQLPRVIQGGKKPTIKPESW